MGLSPVPGSMAGLQNPSSAQGNQQNQFGKFDMNSASGPLYKGMMMGSTAATSQNLIGHNSTVPDGTFGSGASFGVGQLGGAQGLGQLGMAGAGPQRAQTMGNDPISSVQFGMNMQ